LQIETLYLYLRMIINETIKKNAMKTFKIEFLDKDGNFLFMAKIVDFDISDAKKYGDIILATTTWNDVADYLITELN
jgi:nitrate reductase alpha subunit